MACFVFLIRDKLEFIVVLGVCIEFKLDFKSQGLEGLNIGIKSKNFLHNFAGAVCRSNPNSHSSVNLNKGLN